MHRPREFEKRERRGEQCDQLHACFKLSHDLDALIPFLQRRPLKPLQGGSNSRPDARARVGVGWSRRRCTREMYRSVADAGKYIVSSPQGMDKVQGESPVKEVRELKDFSVGKSDYEEIRDSEVSGDSP